MISKCDLSDIYLLEQTSLNLSYLYCETFLISQNNFEILNKNLIRNLSAAVTEIQIIDMEKASKFCNSSSL